MVGIHVSKHSLMLSLQLDLVLGRNELRTHTYTHMCLDILSQETKPMTFLMNTELFFIFLFFKDLIFCNPS